MRRAARVDANHKQIVKGLRSSGCTVQDLSAVGKGCPDILVGRNGVNVLMEIKTAKGKLSDVQKSWHESWRGLVATVTSYDQAIEILNEILKIKDIINAKQIRQTQKRANKNSENNNDDTSAMGPN